MFGKTEELLIILLIILILFGGKKLPELARSIGQSVKEVRKGFGDENKSTTTTKSTTKSKSDSKETSEKTA
jgi:sec-independent protein translocase protein TatA